MWAARPTSRERHKHRRVLLHALQVAGVPQVGEAVRGVMLMLWEGMAARLQTGGPGPAQAHHALPAGCATCRSSALRAPLTQPAWRTCSPCTASSVPTWPCGAARPTASSHHAPMTGARGVGAGCGAAWSLLPYPGGTSQRAQPESGQGHALTKAHPCLALLHGQCAPVPDACGEH